MFGKCSHAALLLKYFLQLPPATNGGRTDSEDIAAQKDGVYAECGIYTVPFSVFDCFRPQAKRFLEKNVSSYNSPSSV